jgi:hypothetical protein
MFWLTQLMMAIIIKHSHMSHHCIIRKEHINIEAKLIQCTEQIDITLPILDRRLVTRSIRIWRIKMLASKIDAFCINGLLHLIFYWCLFNLFYATKKTIFWSKKFDIYLGASYRSFIIFCVTQILITKNWIFLNHLAPRKMRCRLHKDIF